MPSSLISLLLPKYFNVYNRINVGSDIFGVSSVSLKKLLSAEYIIFSSKTVDSYLCA